MLHHLNHSAWDALFSPQEQESAIAALEEGKVIFFPELPFSLSEAEKSFLNPDLLDRKAKNISFDPYTQTLKGLASAHPEEGALGQLVARYASQSQQLLKSLFPPYQAGLIEGRTSFRPVEVIGRSSSLLKDDTRLHVDAFPATPNHGKRILRVFTNINPEGRDRVWNVGEPFEAVLAYFLPYLKKPCIGTRRLLSALGLTKRYRTLYDHYLLQLHDQMKKNERYQKKVHKTRLHFPPGSTWIVMTDSVSHAALEGQFMLEHTSYLPAHQMVQKAKSPLALLEKAFGHSLLDG